MVRPEFANIEKVMPKPICSHLLLPARWDEPEGKIHGTPNQTSVSGRSAMMCALILVADLNLPTREYQYWTAATCGPNSTLTTLTTIQRWSLDTVGRHSEIPNATAFTRSFSSPITLAVSFYNTSQSDLRNPDCGWRWGQRSLPSTRPTARGNQLNRSSTHWVLTVTLPIKLQPMQSSVLLVASKVKLLNNANCGVPGRTMYIQPLVRYLRVAM